MIWPNVSFGGLQVARLMLQVLSRPATFGSASHCVWLKALIRSARNWIRCVLLKVQFFDSDRSVWFRPGWRNSARRELPNVPSAAGHLVVGIGLVLRDERHRHDPGHRERENQCLHKRSCYQ